MKRNYLLITALFLFCLLSCAKEENMAAVETDLEISTKSLHPTGFENNWQNETKITLTNGKSVELPWVRTASGSIPWEIAEDIKKENGWIFASTQNKDYGSDYLIFYNRFTGIVKIFYYYNGGTLTNNTMWQFFDQGNNGYFNQGTYFTTPMDQVLQKKVDVTALSRTSQLGTSVGWNCVQRLITYTGKSGYIDISHGVLNVSNFKMIGNSKETTSGTIVEKHSSNPAKDAFGSVAKKAGEEANSWVKDKADKAVKDKNSAILKNLGTVAASIVGQGVTGLVSSGLNTLFGSFLGKSQKDTQTIQTIELTTTGRIEAEGTITFSSEGIVQSLNGIDASKLGAWNLRKAPVFRPTVCYQKGYVEHSKTTIVGEHYLCNYDLSYDVVINSDIKEEVEISSSYRAVELSGPKWDVFFRDYYDLRYLQFNAQNFTKFYIGRNIDPKTYDSYPQLYQDNDVMDASNQNKVTLISNIGVYIGMTNATNSYIANPVFYSSWIDYTTRYWQSVTNQDIKYLSAFPSVLSNATIRGKKVIYPGNIGINITVKMKVKETGETIVSSRTFLPEYECNFVN